MTRLWIAAAAAVALSACAAQTPTTGTPAGPVYHLQNGGCSPAPGPSPTEQPGGDVT
jgi:hypothetical protein